MRVALGLFLGAGVSAAAALVTVPGAGAGAAVTPASVLLTRAASASPLSPPGDPSTTVTFTVTSGALTMSMPASASLGSGAPGTLISAPVGPISVTDNRALASASWTVTAAETDFANGASLIPATAATYTVGTVSTTGTITTTATNVALSNSAQTVLTGSAGVGNNSATWDATIGVTVPSSAVAGLYTGTLTQSVS